MNDHYLNERKREGLTEEDLIEKARKRLVDSREFYSSYDCEAISRFVYRSGGRR